MKRDAKIAHQRKLMEIEVAKAKKLADIEVAKFETTVDALGTADKCVLFCVFLSVR